MNKTIPETPDTNTHVSVILIAPHGDDFKGSQNHFGLTPTRT